MSDQAGHPSNDHHRPVADLEQLHTLLGHYARMLWDIQKTRVALGNRVHAMERDGIVPEYFGPAVGTETSLTLAENEINKHLERLAKRHPMADWVAAAPGIGLPGFARLIAVTGSLDRFPNVAKLWKYLGLAVIDGQRQRMRKGEAPSHTNCNGGTHTRMCKPDCTRDHHPNCSPDGFGTAYSPQGLVVCHQLGEAIVKVGRGPYRAAYDLKKAQYEVGRPDWPQLRRHRAAMRYAVKELVKDLWIEWHRRSLFSHSVAVR